MRISIGRVLAVTAALGLIGMLCGAVLGAFALIIGTVRSVHDWSDPNAWRVASAVGAAYGGLFGFVLAPIVAWVFLRRVSFASAIAETGLGVIIGILIGAVIQPALIIPLALAGFLAAAIWLWVSTRSRGRAG